MAEASAQSIRTPAQRAALRRALALRQRSVALAGEGKVDKLPLKVTGNLRYHERIIDWYNVWGAYSILIAGFSPIPYKLFTIASGMLHFSLPVFIFFSLIGRGARFYLVAYLSKKGQVFVDNYLNQYIEIIGWGSVILIFMCGLGYYFFF